MVSIRKHRELLIICIVIHVNFNEEYPLCMAHRHNEYVHSEYWTKPVNYVLDRLGNMQPFTVYHNRMDPLEICVPRGYSRYCTFKCY